MFERITKKVRQRTINLNYKLAFCQVKMNFHISQNFVNLKSMARLAPQVKKKN